MKVINISNYYITGFSKSHYYLQVEISHVDMLIYTASRIVQLADLFFNKCGVHANTTSI